MIVDKGWLIYLWVGYDGVKVVWLIVQYVDYDFVFQVQVLLLIEYVVKVGEVDFFDLVLLIDCVLFVQGKLQCYGSQFIIVGDGMMELWFIEDMDGLDVWCQVMGL